MLVENAMKAELKNFGTADKVREFPKRRPELIKLGGGGIAASGFRRALLLMACWAGLLAPGIAPPTPALADQGDIWTLQEINPNTVGMGLHPSVTMANQQMDSAGGFIEFNLSGNNHWQSCPGGSERIRFSWHFTSDVSQLTEGGETTVVVSGEPLHVAAPCTGELAARARITASGTKGGSPTIAPKWLEIIDTDRTFAVRDFIDDRFAVASGANGSRTSTTRYIHLDAYGIRRDLHYAYFLIQFDFHGGGGMQVAYIYRHGTETPMQPPVPGETACGGFTLGADIAAKWQQMGGQSGTLGCPQKAEDEAGVSPAGTTGRYVLFNGGVIIWHRSGPRAGQTFEVHGCIATLYQNMGGTNSWLGFPVSDEYDSPGGRRSDFEGGYITWNAATGGCTAHRDGSAGFTMDDNIDIPGGDFANFDLPSDNPALCRDACAADNMCVAYTFVRAGIQGPAPRCWLKSSNPGTAHANNCCVSGARQ